MERTKVFKAVDVVGWLGGSGYQVVLHPDAPKSKVKAIKYAESGATYAKRSSKAAPAKKKA